MFVEHKEVGEVKELDAASRLLLKAADCIEERGLAKNCQQDAKGRLCAYGALMLANGGTPEGFNDGRDRAAIREASERLTKAVGCKYGPASWNNAPERTKAEVVAKMRAVALGG